MRTMSFHRVTENTTWTVGDIAIYLTPEDDGFGVTAMNEMGEVLECEFFAREEVARRFVAELVKDMVSQ
jgi:hypothetical protein